jgi:uncharacterized protein YndB with AHSA1/START domain
MHAEYATIKERPALRFQRRMAHPVDAVWRAITESAQLEQWFPSSVELDLREGGEMTFTFRETKLSEQPTTMAGEVTDLDPPRLFAFYWGEDHLRFELEPADGGTLLTFTALLDARDKAARDAAGWHVTFDALERHLAGTATSPSSPEPGADWRGLYDEYAGRGFPTGAPIPE